MRQTESSRWPRIGALILLAAGTALMPRAKAAEDPLVVKTSDS